MADERRRALLIGATKGLRGVMSDVCKMRYELQAWAFECVECVGDDATRDGILAALRQLVEDTCAGDAVAIYYSGHGGRCRIATPSGAPSGPAWSYLVPVDHSLVAHFRGIAELELAVIVAQLAERTRNVTVILDCCYAATMVREEGVRALPELPFVPPLLQTVLDDLDRSPWPLDPVGHPDVVRVVATAADASAYELPHAGRSVGGYLTAELCPALAEARHLPQPWETIIGQVRERIMARRASPTQRPEVEGPRGRLPFSLYEPRLAGERTTLVLDGNRALWVRAGRLHGRCEGESVEIQGLDGGVIATGTLRDVRDDAARIELEHRSTEVQLRQGLPVITRSHHLRGTVRVEPSAATVVGLVGGLERAQRLHVVGPGEDATFVVSQVNDDLHVSGPAWLRRHPRPADSTGIESLAADLDAVARAEILLAELDAPRDPSEMLEEGRFTMTVWVMEPECTTPRLLRPGEVLREHTRIYVELRHPAKAVPPLYVNVIERRIGGGLALVSADEPAGVHLVATEVRWVGRRTYGGPAGVRITWPSSVPRGGVGWQSLVGVASERPLDLRSLLEGPPPTIPLPQLRCAALTPTLRLGVVRVAFGLNADDP